MFESPEFELTLENENNELFSNINEILKFDIKIQNISHRFIPEVIVELLTPAKIKNLTPRHRPTGLPSGSQKKYTFKIKSLNNGIFVMTALIKEKYIQRAKLPIIIRIGEESLSLDLPLIKFANHKSPYRPPGGVIQPDQLNNEKKENNRMINSTKERDSLIMCPFCKNTISSNSRFCSICGADLTIEKINNIALDSKIYCPECGTKSNEESKFCAQCGKKID